MFPKKALTQWIEATQDASSRLSGAPVGSGVLSLDNKRTDGLLQPWNIPNPNVAKFTAQLQNEKKFDRISNFSSTFFKFTD